MGRKYLLSAFSPKMVKNEAIWFIEIPVEDAIDIWNKMYEEPAEKEIVIGHQGTADLFREAGFKGVRGAERKPITLREGDEGIICMPSFRPPEGKVYTRREMEELFKEGKITCYKFKVLKPSEVGVWEW